MAPLFLAGHLGLDFVNTAFVPPTGGESVELIGDGQSFVAWLRAAQLLSAGDASKLKRRFGVSALNEAAAEARELRQWARGWLPHWRDAPNADHAAALQHLNRLLERASYRREIVSVGGQLKLAEHGRIDAARELLALPAAQLAQLVTSEDPELVKNCAGAGCILWFVDRTKAHWRVFCSAAACGNRAKVAAFREREREKL